MIKHAALTNASDLLAEYARNCVELETALEELRDALDTAFDPAEYALLSQAADRLGLLANNMRNLARDLK